MKYLSLIALMIFISGCSGKGGQALSFFNSSPSDSEYGTVLATSPNEINNLISWFKADSIISPLSTTNSVTDWPSAISEGSILSVPSGSTAPQLKEWEEGLRALSIDTTAGQALQMSGFSLGSFDNFTLILVVKILNDGKIVSFGSDLSSFNDSGVLIFKDGRYELQHITWKDTDLNRKKSDLLNADAAHIIVASYSNSSDWRANQIYIDGFRVADEVGDEVGTPTPFVSLVRHLSVGGTASGAKFLLGEIAIYGRALSPRDVYSVSKGLGKKWKISIPEKITKEIFDDKIDSGIKITTYESLKRDVLATKGCLGCHNANLKSDGIDLSSFVALKNSVSTSSDRRVAISGQAASSGLYTSVSGLVPTMPRLASNFGGYLSEDHRTQILTWINSGMKENETAAPLPSEDAGSTNPGGNPNTGYDKTLFEDIYFGVMNTKCLSCHNTTNKSGGVDLSSYLSTLQTVTPGNAPASSLYQVVSGTAMPGGIPSMPQTGIFLSLAETNLIKKWIEDGALQEGISFTSGPTGFTSSTTATFNFVGVAPQGTNIISYECSIDGGAYAMCLSPLTLNSLSMGTHSLQVRYVDNLGLRSASSATGWTVDFMPPTITLSSNQALITKNASATFTFSAADVGLAGGVTYLCKMDSNTATACTAGVKTYTPLSAGNHTFTLTAMDLAGNISVGTHSWLIDNVAPTVSLTSLNTGSYAKASSQNITWTATDVNGLADNPVKLEYTTDGTTWVLIVAATTNSSPYSWTLPSITSSTFKIRISVTDKAGNIRMVTSSGSMTLL